MKRRVRWHWLWEGWIEDRPDGQRLWFWSAYNDMWLWCPTEGFPHEEA